MASNGDQTPSAFPPHARMDIHMTTTAVPPRAEIPVEFTGSGEHLPDLGQLGSQPGRGGARALQRPDAFRGALVRTQSSCDWLEYWQMLLKGCSGW
jgi:hypothetical protein